MSARAEQLAEELERVTDEGAVFEAVPDEAWQHGCAAEHCTVAALACHIADGYTGILDSLVKPIAEGREGPASARRTWRSGTQRRLKRTRRSRRRRSWRACAPKRRRPLPMCGP